MPDKDVKKKEVDQFSVGEEKDVGAGEDVLFQNTGTTRQMFKFGCELLLLFSSLHDINAGQIFLDFIYTCQHFLSFLLVELVWMIRVCAARGTDRTLQLALRVLAYVYLLLG